MYRFVLLSVVIALAPMQCRGSEDPALQRDETPGDALYDLAQQFHAKGDDAAYRETLRFLVARYPSSRRAVTARLELEADAGPAPASSP